MIISRKKKQIQLSLSTNVAIGQFTLIIDKLTKCAKLFVDEESKWHKSNRGIEQNIDRFYKKKRHKKED